MLRGTRLSRPVPAVPRRNVPMGATIEDEMHPLRSLLRVKSLPAGA
ncbi:MAG: hypothetical protein WDO13_21645 [Verrucomicrobiota bacterium]